MIDKFAIRRHTSIWRAHFAKDFKKHLLLTGSDLDQIIALVKTIKRQS